MFFTIHAHLNQPSLQVLVFLLWEGSTMFFFICCKGYAQKKLHKMITLSRKWECKEQVAYSLWCFFFFFSEKWVNFAFINMCVKMNFWGIPKIEYFFKDSALSLQGEFHCIGHTTYILMRGSSLWCFWANILLCIKFPWIIELRMPIIILTIGDRAQVAGILLTPRSFWCGSGTEQTKRLFWVL